MARADLLALTEAGLTQMANAGLLKRALRDLDAGQAPELTETADGVIEARFADGAVTRLAAGRTPSEASCSCPSSGMCRHRVTLVLAYQRREAGGAANARAGRLGPRRSRRRELRGVSFGRDALGAGAPAGRFADRSPGARPDARRSPADGDGALSGAQRHRLCSLRLRTDDRVRPYRPCAAGVSRGGGESQTTLGLKALSSAPDDLIAAIDAVLSRLLAEGAIAGAAAHARGLDHARRIASAQGATWLVLALEALAGQIEAYEFRNAHYAEETVLSLAAELFARTRASDGAAALGVGEAMETRMAKTRLMSLGARTMTNGSELTVSALLADTDTGAPMLLEKRFPLDAGAKREAPEKIGGRFFAPGLPIRGVARGQILTSVARRRADGVVTFGAGGAGKTTLMPGASLPKLPAPLWVDSLEALRAEFERRPPFLIRPRNRVQDMHVFDIERVEGQAWAPGAQTWQAAVTLADDGGTLYLERRYDAAAPWALETLFAAAAGRRGPVKRLTGTVRADAGEIICEPWSLTADELIVPDLDSLADRAEPVVIESRPESASAPEIARRFLAGAAHAGRRHRDAQFYDRGRKVQEDLRRAGFETTAQRMEDWLKDRSEDVATFSRAATWVMTLLES